MSRPNKSAELLSEKYLFFHLGSSRAPTVEFVSQEAELGLFYISHNNRQGKAQQTEWGEEHGCICGAEREAIFCCCCCRLLVFTFRNYKYI